MSVHLATHNYKYEISLIFRSIEKALNLYAKADDLTEKIESKSQQLQENVPTKRLCSLQQPSGKRHKSALQHDVRGKRKKSYCMNILLTVYIKATSIFYYGYLNFNKRLNVNIITNLIFLYNIIRIIYQ